MDGRIEASYPALITRAAVGCLAAGISVLTFHAAAWWVLHEFGMMSAPYPITPTAPLGVPVIVSLTFWGALYGIPFGIALPRLPKPLILSGFALGVLACLVGWFIVGPLKGRSLGVRSMPIPLMVNGVWGMGVALLTSMLMPRGRRRTATTPT